MIPWAIDCCRVHIRVLAIDFTQEGNNEAEVLLDAHQSFSTRHLIECVPCVHEEVIALGMELQRLPCEVYNLLGSALRASVLEALEVKALEV